MRYLIELLIPTAQAQTFADIADGIIFFILEPLVPVLFLAATVVFLWGVTLYITAKGDEEKIREGRKYIIWGLAGLFVMVAIWGIVRVFVFTFFPLGLPPAPALPDIPGSNTLIP